MGEKAKIRAYDGIFVNAKALFIEYLDLIKAPGFTTLVALAATENPPKELFDLTELRKMEIEDILAFYYGRKHQNPLVDLLKKEVVSKVDHVALDEMFNRLINDDILAGTRPLAAAEMLHQLMTAGPDLVKTIYIWYPWKNNDIDTDIRLTLSDVEQLRILQGPLEEMLDLVPQDTTYMFSDMANINVLLDKHRLECTSVLLPYEYNYNRIGEKYLIDLEKLEKDVTFRWRFFAATTSATISDEEEE